jgi:hypothetical protein
VTITGKNKDGAEGFLLQDSKKIFSNAEDIFLKFLPSAAPMVSIRKKAESKSIKYL